jgi:hypothetical protein
MAERPVFLPATTGTLLIEEVPIRFHRHPDLAPSQKKKNVAELHQAALARGLGPLLEISSKSELEVGQKLSAFHLKIKLGDKDATRSFAAFISLQKRDQLDAAVSSFQNFKSVMQSASI